MTDLCAILQVTTGFYARLVELLQLIPRKKVHRAIINKKYITDLSLRVTPTPAGTTFRRDSRIRLRPNQITC